MPLRNLNAGGKSIGYVGESLNEVELVWDIPNFFSLSNELDGFYRSPDFVFGNWMFYLVLIPNGLKTDLMKPNILRVGIVRYHEEEKNIPASFHIRRSAFKSNNAGDLKPEYILHIGRPKIEVPDGHLDKNLGEFDKSFILKHKSEFIIDELETVTVCCKLLKGLITCSPPGMMDRMKSISACLRKILTSGQRSDVILKVGDRKFHAHKVILESRCSVFAAMLTGDEESFTVDGISPEAFEHLLSYVYCGDVEWMSRDNAIQLFLAADRYDLYDLKQECSFFLKRKMTTELFFKAMKYEAISEDVILKSFGIDYYLRNRIVLREKDDAWQALKRDNPKFARELSELFD